MKWLGILLIVFIMVGVVHGFQIRPNDIVLCKNTSLEACGSANGNSCLPETNCNFAREVLTGYDTIRGTSGCLRHDGGGQFDPSGERSLNCVSLS